MKNYFLIIPFLVILLSFSCNKDEREPTQDYFKLTTNDNFISNQERKWIILNSDNGEIIKSIEVFNNESYRIDLEDYTLDKNYTVQIITQGDWFADEDWVSDVWNEENVSLECFIDLKPNNWQLNGNENSNQTALEPIGTETIRFDENLLTGSNPFTGSFLSLYYMRNKYTEQLTEINDTTFQMEQYYNPDNMLLLFSGDDGIPLYKWFDNIELNASLYVDEEDLTEMTEHIISFPTTSNSKTYIESEDDPNTDALEYYNFTPRGIILDSNNVQVYYPKGVFDGCYTYMRIYGESATEFHIKRRGSIPNTFKQIDATISVEDNSVLNFTASTEGMVDYCSLSGGYGYNQSKTFSYNLNSSLNSITHFKAPQIPENLMDSLQIDLDNLNFYKFIFYEVDSYSGYDDYIKTWFIQPEILMEKVIEYQRKEIHFTDFKSTKIENEEDMILKERQRKY
ncbi:MAG: hypothetical protein JEZ09_10055 [Salinivirgaceae bacterium]|nr:hypothetical protein [Salinivirgaceae bacterium]